MAADNMADMLVYEINRSRPESLSKKETEKSFKMRGEKKKNIISKVVIKKRIKEYDSESQDSDASIGNDIQDDIHSDKDNDSDDGDIEKEINDTETKAEESNQEQKVGKLSKVIHKILQQKTLESRPVLSLKRTYELDLDKSILEQKAKTKLKQVRVDGYQKPIHGQHEKMLKKNATRGVVQLFNAIRKVQSTQDQATRQSSTTKPIEPSVTKQTFLEELKVGFLKDDFGMNE